MKKVLDTYSSKNDINIKQIVAYKDNILEIEEYKDGFKKEDTMNVMSVTKSVTSLLIGIAVAPISAWPETSLVVCHRINRYTVTKE